MFTLNEEELIKLQEDITVNPTKYEELLTHDLQRLEQPNRLFMRNAQHEEDSVYWYRLLNDGRTHFDDKKSYKALLRYKDHVEGIKYKALDTLRLAVHRLLKDV